MAKCPGCGHFVADRNEISAFQSKADYCSSCRIEASNEGRELGPPANFVLVVAAIAIVFAILQWVFEVIWDYKWWIIGLSLLAYIYYKYKKNS